MSFFQTVTFHVSELSTDLRTATYRVQQTSQRSHQNIHRDSSCRTQIQNQTGNPAAELASCELGFSLFNVVQWVAWVTQRVRI